MASATKDDARIREDAFGGGSSLLFKDCVMMGSDSYFLKDAMGCSLSVRQCKKSMERLSWL